MATFKRSVSTSQAIEYAKVSKKIDGKIVQIVEDGTTIIEAHKYLGAFEVDGYKPGTVATLHKFQSDSGSIKAMNGLTILNKRLADVEPGTYVDVVFLGRAEWAKEDSKGRAKQIEEVPFDFQVFPLISDDVDEEV